MPRSSALAAACVSFPHSGAWRLHRAPTQLSPRDGNTPRDRFDDPEASYRVRYFASSQRGAMLEVLDHFRPNAHTEGALAAVAVDELDILEVEPAGWVPERWLARQRLARGQVPTEAHFVDVNNASVLAALNTNPRVSRVLSVASQTEAIADDLRLDAGTIRMSGSMGRSITQAVSREIYDDTANFAGISYTTRFDDTERCWAVFDDRVYVQFDQDGSLDNLNRDVLCDLRDVAQLYGLSLPNNWQP